MALYAISDLHLAVKGDKPMDVFGQQWVKHDEKILNNWISKITSSDTVIIAGDISWSLKLSDGLYELEWIHKLPGRKIIVKGNHDLWWKSIKKINNIYEECEFIQNNYKVYEDYAVCGTRGWLLPENEEFNEHDEKIYKRECIRLRLSLESAKKDGKNKIIGIMHYPPVSKRLMETEFHNIFKQYGVEKVIYGHIHGSFDNAINGIYDGIDYILTSCDYLNFDSVKILD